MKYMLFITSLLFTSLSFAEDISNPITQITTPDPQPINYQNREIKHIDSITFKDGIETIGPWMLKCQTEKFPNKFVAQKHLNDKQFEIQSCYAEQTIHRYFNNRDIIATIKITPARILFETKNIVDRHKNAKLILGEKQKRYTLYTNCHRNTCLLFPEGKIQNKKIVQEMKQNNYLKLKLIDSQTHKPIRFTFTLDYFKDIYMVIENTYKHMEEILQIHANSFVSSEKLTG